MLEIYNRKLKNRKIKTVPKLLREVLISETPPPSNCKNTYTIILGILSVHKIQVLSCMFCWDNNLNSCMSAGKTVS